MVCNCRNITFLPPTINIYYWFIDDSYNGVSWLMTIVLHYSKFWLKDVPYFLPVLFFNNDIKKKGNKYQVSLIDIYSVWTFLCLNECLNIEFHSAMLGLVLFALFSSLRTIRCDTIQFSSSQKKSCLLSFFLLLSVFTVRSTAQFVNDFVREHDKWFKKTKKKNKCEITISTARPINCFPSNLLAVPEDKTNTL